MAFFTFFLAPYKHQSMVKIALKIADVSIFLDLDDLHILELSLVTSQDSNVDYVHNVIFMCDVANRGQNPGRMQVIMRGCEK